MKQNLTLLLLLGSMYTASAAVPFPSSNAVWTERHGQNDVAPPTFSIVGLKNDDVTIGFTTYHKVYKSNNDLVLDASEYIGGLREDAATSRVYFFDLATNTERLLFDFSLSVGDTAFTGVNGTANCIVHSIDVVSIGGVDHKRLNMRTVSTGINLIGAWVEGVGNTGVGGLLTPIGPQPTCDCGTKTICFTNGATEQYHNPNYISIDCDEVFSTAHVNATFIHSTQVNVFPNPVTGTSHLQLTGNEHFNTLTITDIMGKTIKASDVTGVTDVALDKNNFVPGIYMYHLQNEAGARISGKFIVE